MIKLEIEISTDWFDPENYESKTALNNLKEEIKDSIASGLGIRYSEVNVAKIEIE